MLSPDAPDSRPADRSAPRADGSDAGGLDADGPDADGGGDGDAGVVRTVKAALVAVLGCEALGLVAGFATRSSVATWYPTLAKPWFTPPDAVFAPVWAALYALMGVAAALVWTRRAQPGGHAALAAFGVQLVLNVAWSVVFFGGQSVAGGLAVMAALVGALGVTLWRFARVRPLAAGLLAPYAAWTAYAAALNVAIWWMNG
jgi:tryptophan-rich sensory protein